MKSNKGITLVTLIVIVAVVIIIASVGISTGISALNSTRLKGFYTQLEIVQKRVDEISANDEYYIDDANNKVYLSEQGSDLTEEQLNKLKDIITSEGGDSTESYVNYFRYFTKEQVKTILGIEDIDYNLFINFDERIIIAEDGIQIGKKTYYMLQSATYFVKHKSQTPTDDVDFTVSATKLTDGYYKISIEPTETETTGTIKYKSIFTKYWERTNELEIKVTGDLPQYFDITYRSLSKNKSTTKCYGIYLDADKNVKVTLVSKLYVAGDLLSIETKNSTDETIPDEITSYVLMNDITFTPSSYNEDSQYYNKVHSDTYGYYWKPIGEVTIENSGKFDGNNKEIHVTYTDSDNANYTVTYNKENNYSEPEYEFNIITYLIDEEGERIKLTDFTDVYDVTTDTKIIGTKVKVKRGAPNAIKVQAIPSSKIYTESAVKKLEVEKPLKIKNKDVELEITYKKVLLKVKIENVAGDDISDDGAKLKLNGMEYSKSSYTAGIEFIIGKEIEYTVQCYGYKDKTATYTTTEQEEQVLEIKLSTKYVKITIGAKTADGDIISNATIKINGYTRTSDTFKEGYELTYYVSAKNYEIAEGKLKAFEGTYYVVLGNKKVNFCINATPSDATIVIDGKTVKSGESIKTTSGSTIDYKVSREWYVTKSGTRTVGTEDEQHLDVTLSKNIVKYYVGPGRVSYSSGTTNEKNGLYTVYNDHYSSYAQQNSKSGTYAWIYSNDSYDSKYYNFKQILDMVYDVDKGTEKEDKKLYNINPVYSFCTALNLPGRKINYEVSLKINKAIFGYDRGERSDN